MLNFGNVNTEIPLPGYEVCMECAKWKEKKKFVTIVAMPLSKMGENK